MHVADQRLLLDEVETHALACRALERLDLAWPDTATLALPALGSDGDERAFSAEVQYLVDQGLMQYELHLSGGERTIYRHAAITQHGREVLRELRDRRG
jgi:hypothetical protein